MIAGRYELDREIGRGGATSVWVGTDHVLGRTVALKRLGHSPGSGEIDAARAEREAHLAARVHHPHIVSVYDIADDDEHTWLVMEHVDGPTLADLCDGMPVEPERAARLLAQVADALAAAHAAGMVHRDVKPSNVFVADGEVAKLGDFGIARREVDEALTRTGLITGSPAFLAPEIARGRTATTASDVWAFGVTAYHVATGRPPFDVDERDVVGAVQSILDSPVPILPDEHPLAPVVSAALQHDPDARASMRQVADLLHAVADPHASRRSALAELLVDHVPRHAAPDVDVPRPRPTVLTGPSQGDADATETTAAFADVDATQPGVRLDQHPTRQTPLVAPTAAGTTPVGHRDASPWRDRRLAIVAAAAAVVLAVATAGVVATSGDEDRAVAAGAGATDGGDDAPSLAEQLEEFATSYVTTASEDPAKGFELLTADYQQASGGLAGYEGFWGGVSDVDVERVSPDPDAMRVTYIYSYVYGGTRRTETVTLRLTKDGDRYLIAGADSV